MGPSTFSTEDSNSSTFRVWSSLAPALGVVLPVLLLASLPWAPGEPATSIFVSACRTCAS